MYCLIEMHINTIKYLENDCTYHDIIQVYKEYNQFFFIKRENRSSLVVQWLRLHASTVGGTSSIPGQRTKIPHAAQCSQKQTNKKNNYS